MFDRMAIIPLEEYEKLKKLSEIASLELTEISDRLNNYRRSIGIFDLSTGRIYDMMIRAVEAVSKENKSND